MLSVPFSNTDPHSLGMVLDSSFLFFLPSKVETAFPDVHLASSLMHDLDGNVVVGVAIQGKGKDSLFREVELLYHPFTFLAVSAPQKDAQYHS